MEFKLNNGVIINKAKDLPLEMIMEFFRNSPYYKQNKT